ncbi:MAG: DNA repair protein RadA [Deltaproteobacteria bacterium]|nr:DNA repair protein RadA [Deltaproteobacteria bacterium]
MAKTQTIYSCQNCGYQTPKWLGKCPDCNKWNSFAEETKSTNTPTASRYSDPAFFTISSEVKSIDEVQMENIARFSSGNSELDRLLGGGIVPSSLVLLGGDPGIGKSTLVLQTVGHVAKTDPVLYISGEESASQIKMRAERLGIHSKNLFVCSENNLRKALEFVEKIKPKLLIVDSIQTIFLPEHESAPGSLTQVRECAGKLLYLTKSKTLSTWIIGHMTKEGMIAGPKVLEHLVDTVLYFEGDKGQAYRLLRANKNRFGSTNEVGVFEMTSAGLLPIDNPSALFLSGSSEKTPGSVIVSSLEGSRPFLVEVQVLVSSSNLAMPRRVSLGVDGNRLALLIAILEKNLGYSIGGQDVFLNVVGGLKLSEPSSDLGILAALLSSFRNHALPQESVYIGEVGLGGEIRPAPQLELRLAEIERLGFKQVYISEKNTKIKKSSKMEIKTLKTVGQLADLLF